MKKPRTPPEEHLRRNIKSCMELKAYDNTIMAVKMRMDKSAWERRLSHPCQFKYLELVRLNQVLDITIF